MSDWHNKKELFARRSQAIKEWNDCCAEIGEELIPQKEISRILQR